LLKLFFRGTLPRREDLDGQIASGAGDQVVGLAEQGFELELGVPGQGRQDVGVRERPLVAVGDPVGGLRQRGPGGIGLAQPVVRQRQEQPVISTPTVAVAADRFLQGPDRLARAPSAAPSVIRSSAFFGRCVTAA